jgi:hypothetical protein
MGFEPMRPEGLPVFKTGAINQTPPPLRTRPERGFGDGDILGRRLGRASLADTREYSF